MNELYSNETIKSMIAFIITNIYWFVIEYKIEIIILLVVLIILVIYLKLRYEVK